MICALVRSNDVCSNGRPDVFKAGDYAGVQLAIGRDPSHCFKTSDRLAEVVTIQSIDHLERRRHDQKDLKMDYCRIGRCLHYWMRSSLSDPIPALFTVSAETSSTSAEVTKIREINETMAIEFFHGKPSPE